MATVTDPIILDSTGQAIKNSIDLLTANINRTASNIPYDSNLTIKAAIDGKVSKSGDTMTGKLTVNRTNTGTSNVSSVLELGNNIPDGTTGTSKGVINLYGTSANMAQIMAGNLTDRREITIPDKSGTIALTSDLLYPANTTIKCVGKPVYFNNQSFLGIFVPLDNADKYNIDFANPSAKEMGTDRTALLPKGVFNFSIYKNGFWFWSTNSDIIYWFFSLGRTDTQYEFAFTISPIS